MIIICKNSLKVEESKFNGLENALRTIFLIKIMARIDLPSLNGLRFLATLGIIVGHAVETLWIDDGNAEIQWLSTFTCSALRRSADDLVKKLSSCSISHQRNGFLTLWAGFLLFHSQWIWTSMGIFQVIESWCNFSLDESQCFLITGILIRRTCVKNIGLVVSNDSIRIFWCHL